MIKVALVDQDAAFESALRRQAWPQEILFYQAPPEAPSGDVVLWNLTRHPKPIKSLVAHLRIQDPARAVLLVWDGPEPLDAVISALRLGALDAISKLGADPAGRPGGAVANAIRRFLAQRHAAQAEDHLLLNLLDRSYSLSMINEIFQGITQSEAIPVLITRIVPSLLELSGARHCEVLLAGDGGALPELGLPPEFLPSLLQRAGRGAAHVRETCEACYVAVFPLMAGGLRQGQLLLVGPTARSHQFDHVCEVLEAICGQIALAMAHLRQQEETRRMATLDPLTGLFNRRHFGERLQAEFDRALRYGHSLALVMLDLDRFKAVNDTHGHGGGDRVLVEVGALLSRALRTSDLAVRYGGEEFCLLLPETSGQEALRVAERLRAALSGGCFRADDGRGMGPITASFGVAEQGPEDREPHRLLERADGALYRAKREGRDRVCMAEPSRGKDGCAGVPGSQGGALAVDAPDGLDHRVVLALADAVEARDGYTGRHSHQMGKLARDIAIELALPGPLQALAEQAALLHDVGKIGVPDAILHKPSSLDPQEWAVMRTHPAIGAHILRAAGLEPLADAIAHHHERWDGNGYPRGLAGEDIPLVSRIVAVLDAWGAMTEDRPYRKALGETVARAELQRMRGIQFDPRVVDAVFGILARLAEDEQTLCPRGLVGRAEERAQPLASPLMGAL